MKFIPVHTNRNVFDLAKAICFYQEALGFEEVRRKEAADGRFCLVFLKAPDSDFLLELTWLRDMEQPYALGDNEIHLAVATEDMEAAFAKHSAMGCVCYENRDMGIYFISDPDGYWTEIVPQR